MNHIRRYPKFLRELHIVVLISSDLGSIALEPFQKYTYQLSFQIALEANKKTINLDPHPI